MFSLTIEFQSSWRNSFLSGDNNNPLSKASRDYLVELNGNPEGLDPEERKYIAASSTLKKSPDNYKPKTITLDTVMGLLNRLAGDPRKLYQSRADKNYYFKDLEEKVNFKVKDSCVSNELVFLRNNNKNSNDPKSYSGVIDDCHPLFTSDYSEEFWSVLFLEPEELLDFIIDNKLRVTEGCNHYSKVDFRMSDVEKLSIPNSDRLTEAQGILLNEYPEIKIRVSKDKYNLLSFYCAALYLNQKRLASKYDMVSSFVTPKKKWSIKGFSKSTYTSKDFLGGLAKPKRLVGNPYSITIYKEGENGKKVGEDKSLTKADGVLEIEIDIPVEKGNELKEIIEAAGVNVFYVGKKGLAWVTKIRSYA